MRLGDENDVRRAAELEPGVFDGAFLDKFWGLERRKQTLFSMSHTILKFVASPRGSDSSGEQKGQEYV